MRRAAVVALLSGGAACLVGGCTFLIRFDDVAVEADAETADVQGPEAAPGFPPPCDPGFPLAQVKCNASAPRPNCAKTTAVFPDYPEGRDRANDLVTCNGSTTPTCVQHCPYGCAVMPNGFPDECDDCNGRKDGTYCLKDLRGTDGRNLGLAVDCADGKTAKVYSCGVGRCATKCPRTERAPSCCT